MTKSDLLQPVQCTLHSYSLILGAVDWINEWEKAANAGATKLYRELGLKPSTRAKSMSKFALQPEVLVYLIAARSGHRHFADYHERFSHDEQDLHCQCGQKRAQLHLFSCPKARPHRGKLLCSKLGRRRLPKEVLATPKGVKIFAEWGPATKLFERNRNRGAQEEV